MTKRNFTPLRTKSLPPHYANSLIWRERLIAKKASNLLFKTTLFIAPAGYGKSTLLYQQYQQVKQELFCAWLNLDEHDNNPLTLLQNLIFASSSALNIELNIDKNNDSAADNLLQQFIYAVENNEQPLLLFIDDIHYLQQDDVLQLFKKLVTNVSPYLGLVIAGRSCPCIGLSRLKLNQKLIKHNLQELSFNQEETKALFHSFSNVELSSTQFQSIHKQTEGWAASIQLLAMATEHYGTDELLHNLEEPTGDIAEYLEEIVLQQQSPELQDFLLKTSVLDQFTIDFCQFISSNKNAAKLLETIKSKQLFLIALDPTNHWYRYHHLFQNHLQETLKKFDFNTYQQSHKKASKWCEQHGLIAQSVNYALKGQLFKQAADLLFKYNAYSYSDNLAFDYTYVDHLYINFIEKLPNNYLKAQPLLRLKFIKSLATCSYNKRTDQELSQIDCWIKNFSNNKKFISKNEKKLLKEVLKQRQYIHYTILSYKDQLAKLCCHYKKWTKQNFNTSFYQHSQISFYVAYAYSFCGNFKNAHQLLDNVLNTHQSPQCEKSTEINRFVARTYIIKIWLLLLEGKIKYAQDIIYKTIQKNQLLDCNNNRNVRNFLLLNAEETKRQQGKIHFNLSKLLDLKKIVRKIDQTAYEFFCFYATISKYLWLDGQHDKAINIIKQDQEDFTSDRKSSLYRSLFTNEITRQFLSIGKVNEALTEKEQLLAFTKKYPNNDKIAAQHIQENLDMIDIRFYLFDKKYQQALDLLSPLIKQVASQNRNSRLLQLLIMQAWGHQLANQENEAIQSLTQAFDISIPNGIIIPFIEEGYAIRSLIKQSIIEIVNQDQDTAIQEYQQTLLKILEIDPTIESQQSAKTTLANPLTTKEIEILTSLNSLDSIKMAANKIQITYMTIRWHLKNIYRKLNVCCRTDAVEKGKKLKLIKA